MYTYDSVCVCAYAYILIAQTLKRRKRMGIGTQTPKSLGKFWDERSSAKMLLRPYLCWVQVILSVISR